MMRSPYVPQALVVLCAAALATLMLAGCSSPSQDGSSASAEPPSASSAAVASTSDDVASEGATIAPVAGQEASDFEKADESKGTGVYIKPSGSSSVSDTSGSASSSAGATGIPSWSSAAGSSAKMQEMGNKACGYVQVPSTWVDRTTDLDSNMVDAYEMLLIVDPDSEYTSPTLVRFSFGKAIQMQSANTSYIDIANQLIGTFKTDSRFGDTDFVQTSFNGHNAVIITTSMPDDALQICDIVIDRDNNGHSTVVLVLNCGASESAANEVLSYASTWSL